MPNITALNGNVSLSTNPSSPTTPLSVSRMDAGAPNPLAQISLFGGETSGLQGAIVLQTMNSGTPDGPLEERMRVHTNGNIGIGTSTPRARLEVAGGSIMPAVGNSESAGLWFPKDPGGGAGDAAWMRYYARAGEAMTLEIGIANDRDDHLALMASGGVGIGTLTPNRSLTIANTAGANYLNVMDGAHEILLGVDANGGIVSVMSDHDLILRAGRNSEKLRITAQGNVGIGTPSPQVRLEVAGLVRAEAFESTNPMVHRMYPDNPLVYQDIFDAKAKGAIAKLGNPNYDETTWAVNPWNDRRIIKFGGDNEADGNGAVVTIPEGYDTVWIRVLGERWTVVKAYFLDGRGEDLGLWAGGFRSANCYCPDGSLTDSYKDAHQWVPIPAGRSGRLALISKPHTGSDFWLSGLAFSRNPWAHAVHSAVGYSWALNGGNATAFDYNNWPNWNGDSLTRINAKTNLILRVPVVPSNRDKLLYLVEMNNNWNGCMHAGITVNRNPIERLLATYDNPFARHWNSKSYERYIAARIPAGLIPANARYLDVSIDMSKQNEGIHVREIGTHDLDVPRRPERG